MTNRSLLASLAGQFSPQAENVAVEALGHILRTSASALSTAIRVFNSAGASLPDNLTIRTQASGDDMARPDLVGVDSSGNQVVMIEAKFWAGLTDNQPITYLQRQDGEFDSVLCFLVPARRVTSIWYELLNRLNTANIAWTDTTNSAQFPSAALDNSKRLCVVSWDAFLDAVWTSAVAAGDHDAANDTRQLIGLCELMESEGFVPLSTAELGPDTPILINRLVQVVNGIAEAAVNSGKADTNGMRSTSAVDRFTRYLNWDGIYIALSIHYRLWRTYGRTPLWLEFQGLGKPDFNRSRRKFHGWESSLPPKLMFEPDGNPIIPLTLETGLDLDSVIDGVTKQIESVIELIQED